MKLWLVQTATTLLDKQANVEMMIEHIDRAIAAKVDLIAFPELSLSGYACHEKTYEMAEPVPGPSTLRIMERAQKGNIYVIFGMPELSNHRIYNSAPVFGPEGLVAVYRKLFLATGHTPGAVFDEGMFFVPGKSIVTASTRFGKIGIEICRDVFYPEIARAHAWRGALLIVAISAAPPSTGTSVADRFQVLGRARAIENFVCFAYVNQVGKQDTLTFGGGSYISGSTGKLLAEAPSGADAPAHILEQDIDLDRVAKARLSSTFLRTARADTLREVADIIDQDY